MRGLTLALVVVVWASVAQAGSFFDAKIVGPFTGVEGDLPLTGGTITGSTGIIIADGPLTLGLNQKLILDDDLDSWIQCTSDDNCTLVANGAIVFTWTQGTISFTAGVTSQVVTWNFGVAANMILPRTEAAVPTEPVACSTTTFGSLRAVNDTNDGLHSQVCYCGQLANDSTYDWLIVGTTTACPFF